MIFNTNRVIAAMMCVENEIWFRLENL